MFAHKLWIVRWLAIAVGIVCAGCGQKSTPWAWQLPPGFSPPPVPVDNPMTVEKVTLGEKLFFDTRVSGNNQQACASCHHPQFAFAEPFATSTGSTGERHFRNALSLTNVAYNATFTWAHPNLTSLERQIIIPLYNEKPVEMGLTHNEHRVIQRLTEDTAYPQLFATAFPQTFPQLNKDVITVDNIVKALASYVRSLTAFDSKFDRYAYYGEDIFTEQEIRGLNLFMSERLECKHCHGGFNFSQSTVHEGGSTTVRGFHNTGLYAEQTALEFDRGAFDVTGDEMDKGLFRPPTLRNIALTAPYMHDGSIETLAEVIDFYAAGGRNAPTGNFPGDGRQHRNKSLFVHGFGISADEKNDLVAFLHTLTDRSLLPSQSEPKSESTLPADESPADNRR